MFSYFHWITLYSNVFFQSPAFGIVFAVELFLIADLHLQWHFLITNNLLLFILALYLAASNRFLLLHKALRRWDRNKFK